MAKLLCILQDTIRIGQIDQGNSYRPGDVVAIYPDDYVPGAEERAPKFFWVSIPGVPLENVKRYCEPKWDKNQEIWDETRVMQRRRLYSIDLDKIPSVIKTTMMKKVIPELIVQDIGGEVTKSQLQDAIINKATRQSIKVEGRTL